MIASLASAIVGVNLLALCMVVLRPKLYDAKLYKPMLVNIKLSVLPIVAWGVTLLVFFLMQALEARWAFWLSLVVLLAGLFVWVLLLPNAGYLITELNFNHRDHDKTEIPLWYDIVSVLTLAVSGVFNMCFNVFLLQFMVAVFVGVLTQSMSFLFGWLPWVLTVLLMLLASFGIYLGRYIRFNSWDVKHPVTFVKKLRAHFTPAGAGKNCVLFVVFHTLFFVVFYRAVFGVVLEELLRSITFA